MQWRLTSMTSELHVVQEMCFVVGTTCRWKAIAFFMFFFCIAVLVSIAVPVFGLVNAFPDYYPYWQFKTDLYSESFLLSLDK